jgi:hypothetical protein
MRMVSPMPSASSTPIADADHQPLHPHAGFGEAEVQG